VENLAVTFVPLFETDRGLEKNGGRGGNKMFRWGLTFKAVSRGNKVEIFEAERCSYLFDAVVAAPSHGSSGRSCGVGYHGIRSRVGALA